MTKETEPKPLASLLGKKIADCPCGKVHRIPTREAALAPGSLRLLPQMARRWFPPEPVLCVADQNTFKAAGKESVGMLQKSGWNVTVHLADENAGPVHADRESVETLCAALKKCGAGSLLAAGSGTINDIAKSAATAVDLPQITVATAASMNGYPSAISALTVDGVKTTEPCRPPTAIIADPRILATAPAEMTGAGFGDLLSKNASTADWNLAHVLHGEYYCPFSAAVAEEAVSRCIAQADAIKGSREEGLAVMAEALLRSGISMVIAGSSAPASGGEHLISHLWDMTAHWSGRSPALHGQQTGVTTLVCLRLYEKLLRLDDTALRRLIGRRPVEEAPADFEARMKTTFRDIAEAVLPFARQKYLDTPSLFKRRETIFSRWGDIRRAVAPVVIPTDSCRSHLKAAGAVHRAADLGISKEELAFAYRQARWIRNRYTVLDVAAELGVLEEWQEEVLAAV
jgi:glycerol-1-phosphate dehydrogenase [NAD(P)+]